MNKGHNSDNLGRTSSLLKRNLTNSKKRLKTDEALTEAIAGD
jgi:hypothetical protein